MPGLASVLPDSALRAEWHPGMCFLNIFKNKGYRLQHHREIGQAIDDVKPGKERPEGTVCEEKGF